MRSLRTIGVLIRRQLADDAPFTLSLLSLSVAFVLTLAVVSFVRPHDSALAVVLVVFVLSVLAGLASFAFGVVQPWHDEGLGAAGVLAVRAPRWQIALARIIAGALGLVGVGLVLALGVSGAIFAGLVRWPQTLLPGRLIALLVGLLQIALACYGLGLAISRGGNRIAAALCAAPLAVVLVSLIIVKGFGRPLTLILVPFAAVSLLHVLTSAGRRRRLAIVTRWLIVLTLALVPLYWLRYRAGVGTFGAVFANSPELSIVCYHDFPSPRSSNADFTVTGTVDGYGSLTDWRYPHILAEPLGIVSYLRGKELHGDRIERRRLHTHSGFHFNDDMGLFARQSGSLFAGPLGMADKPLKSLGAFQSPTILAEDERAGHFVVFDGGDRRHYAIRYERHEVLRGPRLDEADAQPLDTVLTWSGWHAFRVHAYYPGLGGEGPYVSGSSDVYLPIVYASGAIAVLDLTTGSILADAGYLPRRSAPFEERRARHRELLDYGAEVIVRKSDGAYAGLIVASLSGQGTSLSLAVFDNEGHRAGSAATRRNPISFPAFRALEYLLETPLPPVLSVASFFAGDHFDAGARYRAVFLWPNSVVPLQRNRDTSPLLQFLWALSCLTPALLLAGFLGWRVTRDAALLGLPARSRRLWLLATLAFGLPTYITYRWTRPQTILVPCESCGKPRRLGTERCYQCASPWRLPQPAAPPWRIADKVAPDVTPS